MLSSSQAIKLAVRQPEDLRQIWSKNEKANGADGGPRVADDLKEEAEGFEFGNFEVFSSSVESKDGSPMNGRWKELMEVEIIDAATWNDEEDGDWTR